MFPVINAAEIAATIASRGESGPTSAKTIRK
jgi:hypothetical protein